MPLGAAERDALKVVDGIAGVVVGRVDAEQDAFAEAHVAGGSAVLGAGELVIGTGELPVRGAGLGKKEGQEERELRFEKLVVVEGKEQSCAPALGLLEKHIAPEAREHGCRGGKAKGQGKGVFVGLCSEGVPGAVRGTAVHQQHKVAVNLRDEISVHPLGNEVSSVPEAGHEA